MDLKRRLHNIVGYAGFELKHNPTPTQADIDERSISCVIHGMQLACELMQIYDTWGTGRKEMSGTEFSELITNKIKTVEIEILLDISKSKEYTK